MPILRAQVSFERATRLPKDRVVNNFAFGVAQGYTAATEDAIMAAIRAFYDNVQAATGSILSKLSPELRTGDGGAETGTRTIRLYDQSHLEPRVPVAENVTFPLIGAGGTLGLPSEVAVCLSFQGTKSSGIPQARRRGRVFIGPINTTCVEGQAAARPHVDLRTILLAAAQQLAAASAASINWTWGIHSQTSGGFTPVNDVWVDNAFDTQRRRGAQVTTKYAAAASAANSVVL